MTTPRQHTDVIRRCPIPQDNVEKFRAVMMIQADLCGLSKFPEVYHYVELLDQSVDRYVVERDLAGGKPVSKVFNARDSMKKFIQIFKSRYLQLTDLEYTRLVVPADMHVMKLAAQRLMEHDTTVEDYLAWVFDVFLPGNSKLCPPGLKLLCSYAVVDKFLFDTKDERQVKHVEKVKETEVRDLVNRARAIIRMMAGDAQQATRDVLHRYSTGQIDVDELRKYIESKEKMTREHLSNDTTGN